MPRDLVYPPVVGALRLTFRLLGLRIRVEGAEHIPARGPVILVSNHVSFLDFAFVGFTARLSKRYVRFLCRYDVWRNPLAGPLMAEMHHIPVDRAAPAGAISRHGRPFGTERRSASSRRRGSASRTQCG